MSGKMCVMCSEYEESGMGAGVCRWAARMLADNGFPDSIVAKVHPFKDADGCRHFEMSSRGLDLCEEYGIEPGRDFPASLHAGADLPTVKVGR